MYKYVLLLLPYILFDNILCQNIDSRLFSRRVDELVEHSLKRNEMQDHLDTLSFRHQTLDGKSLVNTLASTFARKFDERVDVVKNLQQVVETAYGGTSSAFECCRFPTNQIEFDSRFKNKVATSKVCEQISSSASTSPPKLSSAFEDTCIQNLQALPSMKWQYFGSEHGVTTQFPALPSSSSNCGSFDNRFRPWYVQANVPRPKHVVVVIDRSGSMSNTHNGVSLMELAREAAKTVVSTLNPFDDFAVIAFSNSVQTFVGDTRNDVCFSHELAQATPQNKKKVSDFIDTIQAGGGTNYGNALEASFDYLIRNHKPEIGRVTDRVILFLSDGAPSDRESTILRTLQNGNRALNNTAVVMTFGLGNLDFRVLRSMAAQSGGTSDGEDVTRGVFIAITDPSMLRNQMASYYQFYSTQNRRVSDPIWTVPYLDSWGLGQMITASLPVYVRSNLVGVVAVDVTLEELLAESTYFRPNELSYSFVINEAGLVINHPLFPYEDNSDSLFVSVTALEQEPEFQSVFQSMISGGSGNKTFLASRVLAQGDSRRYGVKEIKVMSTYFWTQVPGTKFSVCLVLMVQDTQSILASQGSLPEQTSFLYHRLDLVPPVNPCVHLGNYASKDKSSVHLASRSFSDPEYYLAKTFTGNDVTRIGNYMEGTGPNTERIKPQVKDEVVATQQAEKLWTDQNENTDLQRQVIWRYIGTKNGLYRIFPGTQLPDDYDPLLRPWYEHAVANRQHRAITPPYRDAASRAVIVTLSGVLFEGRATGNHDPTTDEVVAVMGVDILLPYFYNILIQLYPVCSTTSKCLLVDKAGYVIVAEEYVESSQARTDQHVAELEPEITFHLVFNEVLIGSSCANIENGLLQRTYTIDENQGRFTGKTYSHSGCYNYQLIPVENTNTYLIIRDRENTFSGCGAARGSCSCNRLSNQCRHSWTQNSDCECPCTSINNNYQPCSNEYPTNSSNVPSCTPENAELSSTTQNNVDVSKLPLCYEVDFDYERVSTDDGGFNIGPTQTPKNIGPIIGGVIGALVAAFVIICIVKSQCKKRACQQPSSQSSRTGNSATTQPPTAVATHSTHLPLAYNSHPSYAASAPPYNPSYENNAFANQPTGQAWNDPIGSQLPPSYNVVVGKT